VFAQPALADERSFMVTGFERIRVDGPYTVRVTTGGSAGARATGERDALDRVSIRSEGGLLVVGSSANTTARPWNGPRAAPLTIEVRVPRLFSARVFGGTLAIDRMTGPRIDLSVSGAGMISVEAIDAERLDAAVVGTGKLSLAGRARDARFLANGPGTIEADRLDATTLAVNAQGLGEGRFAARNTANVSASGGGTISVAGAATCTVRGNAAVACGKVASE
jgi:hypothetical protein